MKSIVEQLNDAIHKQQKLKLEYFKNPELKVYTVTPRRWDGRLIVVSGDSGGEFNLNPANIRSITELSGEDQRIVTTKPSTESVEQVPEVKPLGEPFSQVTTAEEWKRLLAYYTKCLQLENAQNNVISQREMFFFPLDENDALQILDGRRVLIYDQDNEADKAPLRFLSDPARRDQQLFFGFPIITLPEAKAAPLLFVSLTIEKQDNQFRLNAEEAEINYAALIKLGFSDEDCELLYKTSLSLVNQGADTVRNAVLNQIDALRPEPLPRYSQTAALTLPKDPYCLYEGPCLFWAEPAYTKGLLEELNTLAQEATWHKVPQALKQLFASTPEHDYESIDPISLDQTIYASRVNDQQRQALKAARTEPVTVVTGPPGTGKSQLILNIIADAVLSGQRVLFASRNNEAVNVVINRLHQEFLFRGAVRVGNQTSFAPAANMMLQVLDEAAAKPKLDNYDELKRAYLRVKLDLDRHEDLLQHHTTVANTYRDVKQQHDTTLNRLPAALRTACLQYPHQLSVTEKERLDRLVVPLLEQANRVLAEFERHQRLLQSFVANTSNPLIVLLKQFETRESVQFGGGLLRQILPTDIKSLLTQTKQWFDLVGAIRARAEIARTKKQIIALEANFSHAITMLPASLGAHADQLLSQLNEENLSEFQQTIQKLTNLQDQPKRGIGLLRSLGSGIRLEKQLQVVLSNFGISDVVTDPQLLVQGLAELLKLYPSFKNLVRLKSDLKQKQSELEKYLKGLTEIVREDLAQLSLDSISDLSGMHEQLRTLGAQQQKLQKAQDQLLQRVNVLLEPSEAYPTLSAFKIETVGMDWWSLSEYTAPLTLVERLQGWCDTFNLWQLNRRLERIKQEVASPEDTERLQQQVTLLRTELIQASRKLLHYVWFSRILQLDNSVLQKARVYAEATQALASDRTPDNERRDYRQSRVNHLPDAMQVFPVWATTNLSAKSNFKLEAALFDLVIIDEASQCDIPSALPLLFRAKRIVVIGDPNQLTHITRLQNATQVSQYHGIIPRFGYAEASLFTLASGSVGAHPGTIFLDEHYRSHPRIIDFSNREFYGGRLRVYTNLRNRLLRKELLEHGTGIFWIDVPGKVGADGQKGSKRLNQPELRVLQTVVPVVLRELDQMGASDHTLGIVTPFRDQKDAIIRWVEDRFPNDDRIKVGTAHTFQGDERDVMLFSPVLSEGIGSTQNWLDNTANLLNVALTRARNTLIIVGDWNYCRHLPSSSKYHKLAEYVEQLGVIRRLEGFSLVHP
jgi:hypothetical protein